MKFIVYFIMFIGLSVTTFSCKKSSPSTPNPGGNTPPTDTGTPQPQGKDTFNFRILAYVDKASVEGHLGGSERIVESRMKTLFRNVSNYWNESANGQLKAVYQFTLGDIVVYEGSSQASSFRKRVYDDPMDFNKYDVAIIFDCLQDNGETGNGGGAAGGGSDDRTVITIIAGPNNPMDIFNDNTYRTLTHELGHYRGITDLYQYIVAAKDNPVNNQAFEAPKSIMNDAASGVWGDYAIGCLNRSANYKQIGKKFPDFFGSMFPQKIVFNVTSGGQPLANAKITLYGERGSTRDIIPDAFLTGNTNASGQYELKNTIQYYIPDRSKFSDLPDNLPWGRWFGFLAEITGPSNSKKYVWLPEYEVQMPFFEGKDSYNINVAF